MKAVDRLGMYKKERRNYIYNEIYLLVYDILRFSRYITLDLFPSNHFLKGFERKNKYSELTYQ